MLTGPVARRYAEAVFDIARENNTVDAWLQDVRLIADYFGDRHLVFILGEPNIRFERKKAIVQDLLGSKIRPEAMGLALTLVERNIVSLAGRIREHFETLYNDYRGQAVAQVTSALPLDDASRASITRQLEQMTGKRILLHEAVNSSLLGGVVARVGDTLIDGSVRRKLELLRRQIAQGGDTGDPLEGFDDVKPLLDLPGSGGVARPLPETASSDGRASAADNNAEGAGANGQGNSPAGALASARSGATNGGRSHARANNARRGKRRR